MKASKQKAENLAGVLAGLSFIIAFYAGYLEGWFACLVPFLFGVGYLAISMMLHYSDNNSN